PGETGAEHAESLAFCREAGFAQMHVFPYSRRPGTTANVLPEHVDPQRKRARLEEMLAVARESAAALPARYTGRMMSVLWEERAEGGAWEGLTDNYIRARARSDADLRNQLLPVRLTHEAGDALAGELLEAQSSP